MADCIKEEGELSDDGDDDDEDENTDEYTRSTALLNKIATRSSTVKAANEWQQALTRGKQRPTAPQPKKTNKMLSYDRPKANVNSGQADDFDYLLSEYQKVKRKAKLLNLSTELREVDTKQKSARSHASSASLQSSYMKMPSEKRLAEDEDLKELELRRAALVSASGHSSSKSRRASERMATRLSSSEFEQNETDDVVDQSSANSLRWKNVPPGDDEQLPVWTFTNAAKSKREDFLEFIMQGVPRSDINPLQMLQRPDYKSTSVLTGDWNSKHLYSEDNYEEVEMELDSCSSTDGSLCHSDVADTFPSKVVDLTTSDLLVIEDDSMPNDNNDLSDECRIVDENDDPLQDYIVIDSIDSVECGERDVCLADNAGAAGGDGGGGGDGDGDTAAVTGVHGDVDSQSSQGDDENNDDDYCNELEDLLLRDVLLRSITAKHKQQQQVAQADAVTNTGGGITSEPPQKAPEAPLPWPKHQKVIISVTEDSSDSDSELNDGTPFVSEAPALDKFISSLDQFLQAARQDSQSTANTSPVTVQNVSAEIDGGSNADLSKDRNVVPLQHHADDLKAGLLPDERHSTAKKQDSVINSRAQGDTNRKQFMFRQQKELKLQLINERKDLQQQESVFNTLLRKIVNKKAELRASEMRVHKLREQLFAAETIRSTTWRQLASFNSKSSVTERSVDECRRRVRNLEKQLLVLQNRLMSNQNRVQSTSSSTSNTQPPLSSIQTSFIADDNRKQQHIHSTLQIESSSSSRSSRQKTSFSPLKRHLTGSAGHDQSKDSCARVGLLDQTSDGIGRPSGNKTVDHQTLGHNRKDSLKVSASHGLSSCRIFLLTDPAQLFQFPVDKLPPNIWSSVKSIAETVDADTSEQMEKVSAFRPYKSSLSCFKSYRFSPYYRLKEGLSLSSATYSNKVDHQTPLCTFDLSGKCHDTHCSGQHHSDYVMNERELLIDIVSYCAHLAGVSASSPADDYYRIIGDYVDGYVKKHGHNAIMSSSDLSLLLLSIVCKAANHSVPNMIFTEPRAWRLTSQHKSEQCAESKLSVEEFEALLKPRSTFDGSYMDSGIRAEDNSSLSDDIRYWSHLTDALVSVNDGGKSDDVATWMHQLDVLRRQSDNYSDFVDRGLDVLARSLESDDANKSNSDLWTCYLQLYAQRPGELSDLRNLYLQAVHHAPSYELYSKLLQLTPSLSAKMDVCKKIRQFLCSPLCRYDEQLRSHRLVDIIVYQCGINILSGHFKVGLQVLQSVVKAKVSVIWISLTVPDRALIWLAFIHLFEFRKLPPCLFDPANSNVGNIVNKDPFVLQWPAGSETRQTQQTLQQLLDDATAACFPSTSNALNDICLSWLSAFIQSRVSLELAYDRWEVAEKQCRDVLSNNCHLIDVWITYVHLIVTNSQAEDKLSQVNKILDEALVANPRCVRLFLAVILVNILLKDNHRALKYAERCPFAMFELIQSDAAVHSDFLYRNLLEQPVSFSVQSPVRHVSTSQEFIRRSQADLWLCYCLLLDLQGAHRQAVEAYHTAINCLSATKDICRLWLALLRRYLNIIGGHVEWTAAGEPLESSQCVVDLNSCFNSAIFSLPVRHPLPYSSTSNDTRTQYWSDYSYHNEIVKLHISCTPDDESLQLLYHRYLQAMPANVELVLRYFFQKMDDSSFAEFIMFLLKHKRLDEAHSVHNRCVELGVNIGQELIASLTKFNRLTLPADK